MSYRKLTRKSSQKSLSKSLFPFINLHHSLPQILCNLYHKLTFNHLPASTFPSLVTISSSSSSRALNNHLTLSTILSLFLSFFSICNQKLRYRKRKRRRNKKQRVEEIRYLRRFVSWRRWIAPK
ncbi:hypothetical protein RYX36_020948 [Vicia faba]